MDAYYKKIKELMNDYQDLILENQMVLDELEEEFQKKVAAHNKMRMEIP